jgi:NAD(P)-dependent dehydrogenase (short-subunit alcohol dehydrogenase family)
VLSVASFYSLPFNASYCASKAAEWSLTNALRLELHAAGTLVVGVHPGFIDTDMTATVSEPKISPSEVAAQTLDAVHAGLPEVLTDDFTREVKRTLPTHLQTLYPGVLERWTAGDNPWGG